MHATTVRRGTRSIFAAAAFLATVALVAGCGDDDTDTASNAPPTPVSFSITATAQGAKKKALEFPATVKSGPVTMRMINSDTVPRSAQIVRMVGDHTVDEVLEIVNSEDAKIPDWIQDGGGVPTVKPGRTGTVTQVLAPGRYAIWDDEGGDGDAPSNDELGAKGEFTVTGPASDAGLPSEPATVTATDDEVDGKETYAFRFKGLKAGEHGVRFQNTGEELHHALFLPLAKGKTIDDAKQAFASEAPPKGPPPVDFANAVGTNVIDGGIEQNLTLDLKAGRYAVVCFISDRDGGEPHVAKGMIEELTVE